MRWTSVVCPTTIGAVSFQFRIISHQLLQYRCLVISEAFCPWQRQVHDETCYWWTLERDNRPLRTLLQTNYNVSLLVDIHAFCIGYNHLVGSPELQFIEHIVESFCDYLNFLILQFERSQLHFFIRCWWIWSDTCRKWTCPTFTNKARLSSVSYERLPCGFLTDMRLRFQCL